MARAKFIIEYETDYYSPNLDERKMFKLITEKESSLTSLKVKKVRQYRKRVY